MDDRIIHDIMNDVLLDQGRYPENFMMISQQELCQEGGVLEDTELELCEEGGVKKGGTWRMLGVPRH